MSLHRVRLVSVLFVSIVLYSVSLDAYETLPPGVWHLRVTNPTDAPGKLCVRVYFNPNRDPWHGDVIFIGQGGPQTKSPKADQWLAPGQSSDWVDISTHMSSSPTFGSADQYLSPVLIGAMYEPAGEYLRVVVELASGPEKAPARQIDARDAHPTLLGYSTWLGGTPLPTLALLVPVHPGNGQKIWTAEEAAQQQLDWATACGPTPVPAKHMHFISHAWQIAFQNPTALQSLNTQIVRRLGYNNATQYVKDSKDIDALRAAGWEPNRALSIGREDAAKQAETLAPKGLKEWVRYANFGDEVDIELKATPEEQDAAFVAQLKERGLHPIDFVRQEDEAVANGQPEAQQWKYIHLGGPLSPSKPKLLFEAAVFRYKLWTQEMAKDTADIKRIFGEDVQTGSNFSPHLSVWPDVRKWIDVIRDGGMTMPWSEDWWWQVPEASPQSYGFLLDALRHASDYHRAPYCFYTIPDPGESAADMLRMNYFALGHQAKVIDHFSIYNQVYGTCDYIDFVESAAKFPVIHRILTDVGKIDERLYEARMRPAQAAIVLSIANDVWNTEDLLSKDPPVENLYHAELNVDNHERKALWLALRHGQFPVDLITDEDIAGATPSQYRVLYVVGQELLGAAVPHLKQWVEEGGTLVGIGGGGIKNEYREDQADMLSLYGATASTLDRPVRSIGPKHYLATAAPLDSATFAAAFGGVSLPAFCVRQGIEPGADAAVVATYADGSPAAIIRHSGKGQAVLVGVMPGLAYIQPGQVDRQGMPEVYPAEIRTLITRFTETAGVARPVLTSDPLIEATLQEGRLGAVVTLISFRNQPGAAVTLDLPGLPNARTITSLRHGACVLQPGPSGPRVALPIDQGDFLLVD